MVPFSVCSVKDRQGQYNVYENVWYNRYFYFAISIDVIEGKMEIDLWKIKNKKWEIFSCVYMETT